MTHSSEAFPPEVNPRNPALKPLAFAAFPFIGLLALAAVSIFTDPPQSLDGSYYSAIAQVLPVLLVALVFEGRLLRERMTSTSASGLAGLIFTFAVAEGAGLWALAASAHDEATFAVTIAGALVLVTGLLTLPFLGASVESVARGGQDDQGKIQKPKEQKTPPNRSQATEAKDQQNRPDRTAKQRREA